MFKVRVNKICKNGYERVKLKIEKKSIMNEYRLSRFLCVELGFQLKSFVLAKQMLFHLSHASCSQF
jgi:hypothetical protein